MKIHPAFIELLDDSQKGELTATLFIEDADMDNINFTLVSLSKQGDKLIENNSIPLEKNKDYSFASEAGEVDFFFNRQFFSRLSPENFYAIKVENNFKKQQVAANYAVFIPIYVIERQNLDELIQSSDEMIKISLSCNNRVLVYGFKGSTKCHYILTNESDIPLRYNLVIYIGTYYNSNKKLLIKRGDLRTVLMPHETIDQPFSINIEDTYTLRNNINAELILTNSIMQTPIVKKKKLDIYAFDVVVLFIIFSVLILVIGIRYLYLVKRYKNK